MQPLGTKVYLLKRYSPSDSFCTFFSESLRWGYRALQTGIVLHFKPLCITEGINPQLQTGFGQSKRDSCFSDN